jgi:hypothetical protein
MFEPITINNKMRGTTDLSKNDMPGMPSMNEMDCLLSMQKYSKAAAQPCRHFAALVAVVTNGFSRGNFKRRKRSP